MSWHYELDAANDRIRLRYVDDSGGVHGPRDVAWPESPTRQTAADGWVVDPGLKETAGVALTDMWTAGNQLIALQMLRDLAAGEVEQGTP